MAFLHYITYNKDISRNNLFFLGLGKGGEKVKADAGLNIKVAMLKAGLKGYEVAHGMNMSESKFSRLLRDPTAEQEKEVLEAIKRIQHDRQIGA